MVTGCKDKKGGYHLSEREKCYADNSCSTYQADCLGGYILIQSVLQLKPSDPLYLILSPYVCLSATNASCKTECNNKYPYGFF